MFKYLNRMLSEIKKRLKDKRAIIIMDDFHIVVEKDRSEA